jgi:hypothetical protein
MACILIGIIQACSLEAVQNVTVDIAIARVLPRTAVRVLLRSTNGSNSTMTMVCDQGKDGGVIAVRLELQCT